jgi:hypothetical protein
MQIPIRITSNDAMTIQTDILVLKYAQKLYGADRAAFNKLSKLHKNLLESLPSTGDFIRVDTFGTLGAKEVLFVGVEQLHEFRYRNIRQFAHRALAHLAQTSPQVESICFTLHGTNNGLDEIEALESEIAGIVDALSEGKFPQSLREITIVELDKNRASRLQEALADLFPHGAIMVNKGILTEAKLSVSNRLREAGYESENKPFIFVAMPFDNNFYDIYHYGIRGAAKSTGFLCERIDEAFFTGDILENIKARIRQADLVIADLTQTNANVYLEVGYAWGCSKPTILLVKDANELKFDVKTQKCLVYNGEINKLEQLLEKELKQFVKKS